MPEKHILKIDIENMCDVCRFTHKCVMFKALEEAVMTIEENAFTNWFLDVEVPFNVQNCNMFMIDSDKLSNFVEEAVQEIINEQGKIGGDL